MLDDFKVNGSTAALIGPVLYSPGGMVIDAAVERLFNLVSVCTPALRLAAVARREPRN